MSFFETLSLLPDDPILQLPIAFAADTRPNKVNLGIGSYRDSEGKPLILTSVKKAEANLLAREYPKEYLPIEGLDTFLKLTAQLVYGNDLVKKLDSKLFLAQTLGGTGGLRIGGDFLVQETSKTIFLPNPGWLNHKLIFSRCGLAVHFYRYYDDEKHTLDFTGICKDIEEMPPGCIIMLQVGCHNPTGMDLTFEQWQQLSQCIKRQKIIPFFDFAYQGFDTSLEADARPVRYFAEQGHEMLVANSFSKNFGLYNERVGVLSVITHRSESEAKVSSQIKRVIRSNYSNPPRYGAQLVSDILSSDSLKKDWMDELDNMRVRIKEMRIAFVAGLQVKGSNRDWDYLLKQTGFYSFCGLTQDQVKRLLKDYAIYMPLNGRINIAGLNSHNMDYVIDSIVNIMGS